MHQNLITEIDEFLAETGLSGYRFGLLAAKNGRLVDRLKGGGRVWPETEAQVLGFIRQRRAERATTNRTGAAA
ncbi:hypothetical protein CNY89_14670 [Amaricoccus sp. HAR-UPW-R2A-40]|nr:hypothetical protein CNY89_14670 [Amaricoccus sp. HAR-UPW-R2A-40]